MGCGMDVVNSTVQIMALHTLENGIWERDTVKGDWCIVLIKTIFMKANGLTI